MSTYAINHTISSIAFGSGFGATTDAGFDQKGRGVVFETTAATFGNSTGFPIDKFLPVNCNLWADPSRIILEVFYVFFRLVKDVGAETNNLKGCGGVGLVSTNKNYLNLKLFLRHL